MLFAYRCRRRHDIQHDNNSKNKYGSRLTLHEKNIKGN